MSPSTVDKIVEKIRKTGHGKYIPNIGRPKIAENAKLDVMLSVETNTS